MVHDGKHLSEKHIQLAHSIGQLMSLYFLRRSGKKYLIILRKKILAKFARLPHGMVMTEKFPHEEVLQEPGHAEPARWSTGTVCTAGTPWNGHRTQRCDCG